MKNKWDIIVVGAGPAGLFAAKEAASEGRKVLVLERKREIGLPIRCGEAIGHEDLIKYIPLEERWVSSKVNTFIIVTPNGREVELKSDIYSGYVLNRDLFEQDIACKAAEAGATIRMKTNVVDLIFNDDKLTGVIAEEQGILKHYYADMIIASDGVESKLAKKMGMDTHLKPTEIEACVQFTLTNVHLNKHALYIYVGKSFAPGGYAWVFPKANNCANVGLGINGKYATENKHSIDYLNDFVERFFPEASVQKLATGGVPVTKNLDPLIKENFLVAGDAGHLVNPLNGGGITHAMDSGIQAGKAAAEACKNPEDHKKILNKYNKYIRKHFGREHESLDRIKDVIYQLSDDEYNKIAEEVIKIDINKRTFMAVFSKAVKKHPELLLDVARAFTGI
ncbi:MAG: geranylgeranyl reductase family protein [Candidatus Neomarinimicrobiota bacterium]|jgi:digeranylgeranylglycerophospholipid reductase